MSARSFHRPVAGAALAAALACPLPAFAQDAAPTGAATTPLEEIAVEGRGTGAGAPTPPLERRTEAASRLGLSVKETPASVDVITQQKMQEEGVRSLIEAYQSAPGVTAGNLPGEPGVTAMRGFSRGAVGYSVDGFRAIDPLIASRNYDTFSFDRIEILKGPASVVGGSGALAGTINVVTRKPEIGVNTADALLSYGSFDSVRAGAAFNAAISPNAAANASVLFSNSDGFVKDTDARNVQITTGVKLEPSDRFRITAAFDYFQDRYSTPYQGAPLLPRNVAQNPSGAVSAGDLVLDKSIWKKNYNVTNGIMKSDSLWARTSAELDLSDAWTLRNDFGFYKSDRFWANSEDFSFNAATGLLDRSLTLISHDHEAWSNRTSVNFDGEIGGLRNRFSTGFEYMETKFGSNRRFGETTSVDPFDPVRGTFPSDTSGFATRQNFGSRVKNSSAFVENALNVTPDWIVVAGLRQDWIDLDRTVDDLNLATRTTFGRDFSATSWRLGTVYDVTEEVSLFGQYTTAITPVTTLLLSNMQRADFDLTTGRSFEAGVKASLWDDRVVATASAYQIDQDDILTRDPNDPLLTVQGGSQRSRGVELDVSVALTERWKVNANAALLKSEFTKLSENGVSLKGKRPLNVPKQTFNLWTTYRLAAVPLTLGAGIRHVGDFYTDNANTIRVKGRTLLDASLAYEVHDGGTVTLRARNLTNKFYGEWSGYSSTQVYVGAPRSFDLTYAVKF